MRNLLAQLRALDWILVGSVLVLVVYGLVMLYSLTLNVESPDFRAFRDQCLFAGVGFLLFFIAALFDYRYLRNYAWVLFVVGALLLIGLWPLGSVIRGVKSWYIIGGFSVQPIELVKLFLVIFLAKFFTDHAGDLSRFRSFVASGAGAGVYMVLAILQPDLGSALILLGVFCAFMLIVNIRRSHLLLLLGLFVVLIAISWSFVLRDYQRDRILTVLHPSRDPLGRGYNAQQAIVAIGSGRLVGRGLGLGSQSQLNFLPEQKTDFIFAVIAEELGFVGAVVCLGSFFLVFFRLTRIARRCPDPFGSYMVYGFLSLVFVQMTMNVGMNLGLLPVAGVPLPLVSAGGSSLITLLCALGLAESVVLHSRRLSYRSP